MSSIFFSESGKGMPVVFLHGYCETSYIWENFQKHLSRRYRVICVDLPGFGKSPRLNYAFSLKDVAVEIKDALDARKVSNYVMIGHSLGGYVALAFIKQFSYAVRGIGLFHSHVFQDSSKKKEDRTRLMEFIKKNGVKPFVKTFIPSLFYDRNTRYLEDSIAELQSLAEKTSPDMVIEYSRAMRDRESSVDFIRKYPKSAMFIIGEKDKSLPLKKSLEQAVMPAKSHILRLRDVGHMGMFEKPEETLKFVEKFIGVCR